MVQSTGPWLPNTHQHRLACISRCIGLTRRSIGSANSGRPLTLVVSARMTHIYRKPKIWRTRSVGAGVIGDAPLVFEPQKRRNKSQENARKRKACPTPAERELENILNALNDGALRGRFFREWTFADRWILDFFFHEIRLGIEVDGSIHSLPS